MSTSSKFDVVVYGATGFTGRLVAEYLVQTYPTGVRWAMAGRSAEKLAAVRDEIGAPADTPLIVADTDDPASISAMVAQARCILTTVGPYALYGSVVVAACAAAGVDYVDLCGEVLWMHDMIGAHAAQAKASGARIVLSCGFDSIPFDLGVQFLQEKAVAAFGAPCKRVRGRVRKMKGTFSGGTAASGRATMAAVMKNPSLMPILLNPFSLCEGFTGPEQPTGAKPIEEADLGVWAAPFIMAPINTKNVHRSNALMGHAYGADFVYDEMILTGPGEGGRKIAEAIAADRSFADEKTGPKPGEGPSKEEREAGGYDIVFIGEGPQGQVIKAAVVGDRDPGYGSTSKMIAEAALCLVQDSAQTPGGVWTSAPAMGARLRERLIAKAGLTFAVE